MCATERLLRLPTLPLTPPMSTDLCVPFPLSRWPIAGAGLVVSSPMVLSSVIVNVAAPDVTGAFGDRAGERPAPDAMVDIRIDVRG